MLARGVGLVGHLGGPPAPTAPTLRLHTHIPGRRGEVFELRDDEGAQLQEAADVPLDPLEWRELGLIHIIV
jgi:hypothetical protein